MDVEDNNVLPDEGVQLCLHCGLCCTGYMHNGAVINNNNDLILAKKMGAIISIAENNEQIFAFPCPKFDGKCSIFPERPSVCENHQCDLLTSVNTKKISLQKAKSISDEMKNLCISLTHELNIIVPNNHTECLKLRFKPLFVSEDRFKIQKEHPSIFVKYAAYLVLKSRYFYVEDDIHCM